jgi:hypothetical protein
VVLSLSLAVVFTVRRSLLALRASRLRCEEQLSALISSLRRRHLVLGHLWDESANAAITVPSNLQQICDQSRDELSQIDPGGPNPAILIRMAAFERELAGIVDDLMEQHSNGPERFDRSAIACLRGLQDVTRQILETASTYNSSAIIYQVLRNSKSALTRRLHPAADYCELELAATQSSDNLHGSPLRIA